MSNKELIAEKEGFKIYIAQDDDPLDPRSDDNLGRIVCFHKRYNLGDKHDFSNNTEFMEWWKKNGKGGVLLPLALLDHSGLHMWIGSDASPFDPGGWDSGQVGWIYTIKDKIIKEYGKNKKKLAEKVLRQEIETYDQYLQGDVYGYILDDKDGEHVESCWGFFGYDYVKKEAIDVLKRHIDWYNQTEKDAQRYMAL